MNLTTTLDIIASCLGFFSALFFSIGVLHFKPGRADDIATKMWGKGLSISVEMLSQKADFIVGAFLVGAFLLVLSFSVQFAIKAVPWFFEQPVTASHLNGVAVSVGTATAIAIVSRIAGSRLGKVFLRQLQVRTEGKL